MERFDLFMEEMFIRPRYTFSTNFVLVRRLVRHSAKRAGGNSLERRRKHCAEAGGLGFVAMHDGIFKQGIQPLDFLNLSSIARKSEGGSFRLFVASPFVQPPTASPNLLNSYQLFSQLVSNI